MVGVFLQLAARTLMMFTNTMPIFLFLYAISNIGAGLYLTAPFAMIAEVVEPQERPKYYGMLVTFKAVGSLLGPLITGGLMDTGFATLAFISYLPFLVLSVPFILALYPNRKTQRTTGGKFDLAGLLLLVISVTCVIFLLSLGGKSFKWLSPISVMLMVVGVVGIIALIRIENKHPNPSVAIRMFRKKRFTFAFLCSMFISAFASVFGAYVIVYAQQVMEVSSTLSSTASMPMTISQAIFGVIFGRYLGKKFSERFRPTALFSLLLVTFAMILVCLLRPTSSILLIYAASILGGIGTVVPQSAFANFFQTELKPEEIGAAQGMFSFGGTGGSCIFMAITGAMTNAGGTIYHVFILATAWCAAAFVIGFIGFRMPRESAEESR